MLCGQEMDRAYSTAPGGNVAPHPWGCPQGELQQSGWMPSWQHQLLTCISVMNRYLSNGCFW